MAVSGTRCLNTNAHKGRVCRSGPDTAFKEAEGPNRIVVEKPPLLVGYLRLVIVASCELSSTFAEELN